MQFKIKKISNVAVTSLHSTSTVPKFKLRRTNRNHLARWHKLITARNKKNSFSVQSIVAFLFQ